MRVVPTFGHWHSPAPQRLSSCSNVPRLSSSVLFRTVSGSAQPSRQVQLRKDRRTNTTAASKPWPEAISPRVHTEKPTLRATAAAPRSAARPRQHRNWTLIWAVNPFHMAQSTRVDPRQPMQSHIRDIWEGYWVPHVLLKSVRVVKQQLLDLYGPRPNWFVGLPCFAPCMLVSPTVSGSSDAGACHRTAIEADAVREDIIVVFMVGVRAPGSLQTIEDRRNRRFLGLFKQKTIRRYAAVVCGDEVNADARTCTSELSEWYVVTQLGTTVEWTGSRHRGTPAHGVAWALPRRCTRRSL